MTVAQERAKRRIDAHQHFWRYDPSLYSFIDERMPVLKRDYLPKDLEKILKEAGFSGCVAVQARQTLEETRWLLELARHHDFIQGVVGWVDLRAPDLEARLEELVEEPRLCGIRHIVQAEPSGFLSQDSFKRGVGRLSRAGLVYDMLVYEQQLPEASELMASLPDVSFVLDHLGKPNLREPNVEAYAKSLRPIAELPHVACKLSGLVTEADWGTWTRESLRPFLEVTVELFGPERLIFGSDWPVCLLAAGYGDVLGIVGDYFKGFSESERAGVFGENAARIYRIGN